MALTFEDLTKMAEAEAALAKHLVKDLPVGTIYEGSPTWEIHKLHLQAAQRAAAFRDMAADLAHGR